MSEFVDRLRPHPESDGAATLSKERGQSGLDGEELSNHLFGATGFLERQKRVLEVLQNEPVMNKTKQLNLSRPNRYILGLARAKTLRRLADKHGWTWDDDKMATYLLDEVSPYHLHVTMFSTTVREQASEEQRKYWLPKIERYEIIGAYSQARHGSNVRGLELEARYDPRTKEFVLHSPYLTSSKWWNGTLGRTANHTIAVAQLMLPDPDGAEGSYKSMGPHLFIVQIRDLETHEPLPGIVIGDIGPKYGYWSMDNGYMLLNHFRIPHSALLSRYAQVDAETGRYTKPERPQLMFGTMTFVRSEIIMQARMTLARVATVAIRYCSIRKQFRDRDETDTRAPEMAVLDYATVRARLFPLLATAFALHYTGSWLWDLYWKTRQEIEAGNTSQLASIHVLSSGLKSLCTTLAADGIEVGRRALGGHGFGAGSGLIAVNNDYHSRVTVEGDNYMITQQVASHLLKIAANIENEHSISARDDTENILVDFKDFRKKSNEVRARNVLVDDKAIVQAFEHRAAYLTFKAYEARYKQKRKWNSLLVQFYKLSNAFSQAIIVKHFFEGINADSNLSERTKSILLDLYRLYALSIMGVESYEFSTSGAVGTQDLDGIDERAEEIMLRIRPHAVKLVDAWKIPDYLLDSALGRYDGKVYEDLFDRAHRRNPLNKLTFNPNYWHDELVKNSGDGGLQGKIMQKL